MKSWAVAGVGFSVAAGLFCLLGLVQATWLGATPNFPQDRAARNVLGWGLGGVTSLAILIVSVLVLRKQSGR